MSYQIRLKSPAWEVEKVTDSGAVLFSARNTGLASFVAVPVHLVAEVVLKRGLLVECDSEGRFVQVLTKERPDLPLRG